MQRMNQIRLIITLLVLASTYALKNFRTSVYSRQNVQLTNIPRSKMQLELLPQIAFVSACAGMI